MIDLRYENKDKSLSSGGWVINHNQLQDISNQLTSLGIACDMEMVESVLLIANGEYDLLKKVLKELEIF
ncbi:hypothetical protein [Lysinibacillus fusiformis]|uniref:hypothetical protein n=1 Tax=Lysinibacillus fusiformis TaxID=28031 RepID=UPI00263B591C|nr:hypothetical protein [Lysinibacillus fusiformis]MDC6267247.1 hypothetical protein [Lysinibacillus sphaericus]MDN4968319.1 hypothetical protein [Lysinibacillus fusiformis]MDN4968493.1 hypothetical protein [Lysinibacillus fusiformis]